MENKYYYFDLKQYEEGEVIETIENGVWKYGMEYLRIYKDLGLCVLNETQFGPKGFIYEVEPLATIFDSEIPNQYLSSSIKILKMCDKITWM